MALNSVYELTLQQRFNGQDVNNVFFYHQVLEFITSNPSQAQTLAENFVAQKLTAIRTIQAVDVLTVGVKVRDLYDAANAYELPLSLAGAYVSASDTLPTFSAVGFDLAGDNAAVKNGSKRFAGLIETFQADGVITEATIIGQLNTLADALEGFVTVGTVIQDDVFRHVIVKRVRTGSPGAYEYRLPATALEATLSAVVVATWKALITSQISRKIGVGV